MLICATHAKKQYELSFANLSSLSGHQVVTSSYQAIYNGLMELFLALNIC